ncbi:hypothetical protein IWQ62_001145 [Dispira parvispora]|uniref:Uncharacterized protein n=1 Tax=Dispira parvispora TaxID=1520584 RepID=A0A9W8AYP1_9FUNG|nr:hypothetical protein IWQ62_001145 [Dispira parvispora]
MASHKLLTIQREADHARCHRETAKLPDLGRRYLKHHSQRDQGEIYQTILLCEHRLHQLEDQSNHSIFRTGTGGLHLPNAEFGGLSYSTRKNDNTARGSTDSGGAGGSIGMLSPSVSPRPSLSVTGNDASIGGLLLAEGNRRGSLSRPTTSRQYYTTGNEYIQVGTIQDAAEPGFIPPRLVLHAGLTNELVKVQRVMLQNKDLVKKDEQMYWQFKVLLAMVFFYLGHEGKCSTVLLSIPDELKSSVAPNYARALTLQRYTLLGMCMESADSSMALVMYDKATAFSRTIQDSTQIPEILRWSQIALFRSSLLRLADSDPQVGITACRSYLQHSQEWPSNYAQHQLVVFLTQFIRALSRAYRLGYYRPPGGEANGVPYPSDEPSSYLYNPATFKHELFSLYQRYKEAVGHVYRFPQAHETHYPIIMMVDQAVQDWELAGSPTREDTFALVQFLYRMSRFTYNSLHIYRHLVRTLIAYGDYLEAEMALETYWGECARYLAQQHPSAPAFTKRDSTRARSFSAPSPVRTSPKPLPNVPTRNSSLMRPRRDTVGAHLPTEHHTSPGEEEDVLDMVDTLVVGCRMLILQLEKHKLAQEILDYALHLCQQSTSQVPRSLLAKVYQHHGLCHSQICIRAEDPERRAKYQEGALKAYTRATELDPRNPELLYHLALQHALERSVHQALGAVKRALTLRPEDLKAWHLLALLLSSQKEYQKALHVCEVGCRESGWREVDADIQQAIGNHGDNDPLPDLPNGNGEHDSGETYLRLKMTQCMIYELIHGPQRVLQLHTVLFTLYGRIYGNEAGIGGSNTPLMSTTMLNHPLAGLTLAPSSPNQGLGPQKAPMDVLSVPDLSLVNPGQHRGARALFSHSTRTVHMATQEGRLLAKIARDKIRGKRRTSIGSANETESPRFSTLSGLSKVNFQSTVSVNSYTPAVSHGRNASTSPWLGPSSAGYTTQAQTNETTANLSSGNNTVSERPMSAHSQVSKVNHTQPDKTSTTVTEPAREVHQNFLRRQRARKALADLWLMSAAAFRRLERYKDAHVAIREAESVYPEYPAVWCQYGLLMAAGGDNSDLGGEKTGSAAWLAEQGHPVTLQEGLVTAIRHFMTGLSLGSIDVPCRVHLARAYLRIGKTAIATGLLQDTTRGLGWDVAEAWTLLSQTMLQSGNAEMASDYLLFALELENTKPILPFQSLPW